MVGSGNLHSAQNKILVLPTAEADRQKLVMFRNGLSIREFK